MEIYPSLISGDILNIEKMITTLDGKCDGYHLDVMDDHFVPNLTWGPAFVTAIGRITTKPIHLHLMVDNPTPWLDRVTLKKDDVFIFHHEVFFHIEKTASFIARIKKLGCFVGVAINPATPVDVTFSYLPEIDHLLLMSVNPGFSGQKFMTEVVQKVAPLIKKREEMQLKFTIGMDGGVGVSTIKTLKEVGVDQVGIASAIFSQSDPTKALEELYKAQHSAVF